MRVIAGSAKGVQLQSVPGTGTRPISDRVKEALFNILADSIVGADFLDLFAGTGSVGIEALSRGANSAVFVEKQPRAVSTIHKNLRRTRLEARGRVTKWDGFRYLAREPEPFHVVYVAPPQYIGLWSKTLHALDATPQWLSPGGVAIVQIFPKDRHGHNLSPLYLVDQRRYGSTLLGFFEPCS